MGSLSTVGPSKVKPNKIQLKVKYIINLGHPYMPQRNDNPKTTNKKGYPYIRLGMCYPNHPLNGRYPFLKPLGASSPCPPSQACPYPGGTAQVRINPCPWTRGSVWPAAEEAKEAEDR